MQGPFTLQVICPNPTCQGKAFILQARSGGDISFETLRQAQAAKEILGTLGSTAKPLSRIAAKVSDEPLPDILICPHCRTVFYPGEARLFVVQQPDRAASVGTVAL